MQRLLFVTALFLGICTSALAADGKGIRFWNLTASTISKLQLSPVGKDAWGINQCVNDRDGSVDHDERLKITGIEPGHYDVKFASTDGRVCIVKNIEVKANAVFSISESELTDCKP